MCIKLREYLEQLKSLRLLSNLTQHLTHETSVYPTIIPSSGFCNRAQMSDRELLEHVVNDYLMELGDDGGAGHIVTLSMEVKDVDVFQSGSTIFDQPMTEDIANFINSVMGRE